MEPATIGDHAVIGDCRSAALVSRDGDLSWLCWPRFESPALFAGLLDPERGGSWSIRPAGGGVEVRRRYLPRSAVLETRFETESGVVSLQDFMPVVSEAGRGDELRPEHQLLRRLECTAGAVEVDVRFAPRPDFGRRTVSLRDRGPAGILMDLGSAVLAYRSELPGEVRGEEVRGRVRLEAGQVRWSSLAWSDGGPAYILPLGATAERRREETLAWWRDWLGDLRYEGGYVEAIERSAMALKLMTYSPSGAVIAAPTTSLPESIGGARNWDYRYCWLRDAALTVRAFYALGCRAEGEGFASWILHATRLTWPELGILYDVHGNRPPGERTLGHLSGHRDSRPVRVGNDARDQLQLDVYGEVVGAVVEFVRRGGRLDRATRKLLRGIADVVCRRWHEPDHGIWEIRSEPRPHTYSRVRCWCALVDLLSLDRSCGLRLPRARLESVRDRIRAAVEEEGWNERLGSYVSFAGADTVDASLLLLPEHGFITPANRERFLSTLGVLEDRLAEGPLVFRYRHEDGLGGPEGAFGICSFWRVMALVHAGEPGRARRLFEELLTLANDVGLYGEEIGSGGAVLGNFPQAYTHVGLIHAALALGARPEAAA